MFHIDPEVQRLPQHPGVPLLARLYHGRRREVSLHAGDTPSPGGAVCRHRQTQGGVIPPAGEDVQWRRGVCVCACIDLSSCF